ncbi:MAG: hypothetical protein ACD_38C00179G0005 [uncultured bacterium]|uniref:Uncharacterized protein n=1 Tax=Candidatus Daviesbacteria bacterium GW2011_GWC2_40_12 TaxID=1618431 RepID=A0A0G0QQL3_9BACT|nr:MAG: hypothetical protein ACD_38C00179G0005 [uncultured bacterium]KKQ82646.1 MAG: hypothetical protein UT04_C0053G0007 [Candidatus Daviesbacteria bacterium GW2011_GWF2_38_7]KKR16780.1 MAG: hypothetical protein UT45_C0004G0111 [Candidatus Daviesbacteria bacterium GW2011_GWA2_39_33]KKR42438.1 MAG: hypothetical protein UT77_C0002G0091 [Candidatus Daviesbacteria bacterium GW2011_GWC2_40_12]OGE22351.1 MAG: hypothetical protein A2778_00705 [Candidatus Daviesbacteria bacterium RIFCSPHIGHO2_01_FULL_
MHKPFYASGFLYSLKTNQILLFQTPGKENEKTTLTTIGGEGKQKEDPQAAFQRIIKKLLNLDLKTKDIYPIYDYFQDDLKKDNFVFYAELKRKPAIGSSENGAFVWVTFEEALKVLFPAHSKQDVIVGQRVINAKWRESQGM